MKKVSVLLACAAGGLALVLTGCSGTATKVNQPGSTVSASKSVSGTSQSTDTVKSESSFKDGVLVTQDLRVEITSHSVIQPGKKGNEYGSTPVIALWYKTTNLSGKKISPMDFLYTFTAYQDNNPNSENKLDVGSLPDSRFGSSQMENIKKGGTVENAIAYKLDDTSTPVNLVASTDFGLTEIGRVTYNLK
jgi:hypothetical protein